MKLNGGAMLYQPGDPARDRNIGDNVRLFLKISGLPMYFT